MRRVRACLAVVILVSLAAGCFGQPRATGKYGDQDKPKPADRSDK
jgi:hypothetical protein